MKRLITICLVLLLCASSAYGVKITDAVDSRDDIERKVDDIDGLGRGAIWYVYSGATGNASGTSWTDAALTIEAAVVLAAASASGGLYDNIHVGQAHNQSLTTADGVDLDLEGLYLKGFGRGSNKPTLDYDSVDGEFVIGAANCKVENFRLRVSSNAVAHAMDVEAAAENFQIIDCEFGYAETPADEFVTAIEVASTVSGGVIRGCRFDAGGQASVSAISTGTGNDLTIEDNFIFGDYSYGCIENRLAANNVVIRYNTLFNGTMGGDNEINTVAAIVMANNTGGLIAHNDIICAPLNGSLNQTGLAMRTGDDMVFLNNRLLATDGDDFAGGLETGATSIAISAAGDQA